MCAHSDRRKVHFESGGVRCTAWFYPGANGGCVVMAGGLAVTKEPATDRFAARFHEAGFSVLAFDYRRIGESEGEPRQVLPVKDQCSDWRAAVTYAGTLPEVDPSKIAAWAFSLSAGHLLRLVGSEPIGLTAVVAQNPYVGGLRATLSVLRHQTPRAGLGLFGLGLLDAVGGLLGRPPRLVALAGPKGRIAVLTTPDGQRSAEALNPDNRYPAWIQAVAARSTTEIAPYHPGRAVSRIDVPVLFVVCDDDVSALAESALAAAARTPSAEVLRVPGGHYEPFLSAHEAVVAAEIDFLARHLSRGPSLRRPAGRTRRTTSS